MVNYAYDNCYTAAIVPRPCPPASAVNHPRGAEVLPSARAYSDALSEVTRCTLGTDCRINGANWYQTTGSLQDWCVSMQRANAVCLCSTRCYTVHLARAGRAPCRSPLPALRRPPRPTTTSHSATTNQLPFAQLPLTTARMPPLECRCSVFHWHWHWRWGARR